jgi:L-asparaginase
VRLAQVWLAHSGPVKENYTSPPRATQSSHTARTLAKITQALNLKSKMIKILITGGTIDDLEYELPENAPKKHKSIVPELLKQAKVTLEYNVEELFQKDSRDINNTDREIIHQKCRESEEKQIVITHGTMTMPETAKYLGKKKIAKTIVLLGAMIPANKKNSDALFNIGVALSAVQLLSNGVYITMNGRIFPWDNVSKNMDKGVFETEK